MRADFCVLSIMFLVVATVRSSWAAEPPPDDRPPVHETSTDVRTRSYVAGALLVPTITSGYWMAHLGDPPNTALFATHKLAAVSSLVLLDVTLFQRNRARPLDWTEIAAAAAMNLCFVGTVATGALLSIDKPMPGVVHAAHRVAPWLTALATSAVIYLLNRAD